MTTHFKINQTSKWQVYAISTKTYKDGNVYIDATKLIDFKDLSKAYMVIVYKRDYNGMIKVTRTDSASQAFSLFSRRNDTLSTSHAAIATKVYDTGAVKEIAGRDGYKLLTTDGTMMLVSPKGFYL